MQLFDFSAMRGYGNSIHRLFETESRLSHRSKAVVNVGREWTATAHTL
jgi:hypothetical protein